MTTTSFVKRKRDDKKPTLLAAQTTNTNNDQPQPLSLFTDSGQFEGEFRHEDVAIPYLSLVGKSGELPDLFPKNIGEFVYDKTTPLGNTVNFIVAKINRFYLETVEFGGQDIPEKYDTLDQAKASGKEYVVVATLDLIIEVDATHELAPRAQFEHDGKAYLLARYTVKKGGYKSTVGIFLRDYRGFLQGNLLNGKYQLTSTRRAYNGNTWYEPTVKAAGKTSDELRQLLISHTL